MTLAKDYEDNQIEITCDGVGCRNYIGPMDSDDFDVLNDERKRKGWAARKAGVDGWEHYCPNCRD